LRGGCIATDAAIHAILMIMNAKTIKFKKVALIGREMVEDIQNTLNTIADFLKSKNIEVVLKVIKAESASSDTLEKEINLIIVIGGDGSLLQVAPVAVEHHIPVLGINRGQLGFLTDIYPKDLDQIECVLQGHYVEEKRFLLEAQVRQDKKLLSQNVALNEVVLLPGELAQLIKFEIYIDDDFVCKQRADGLIASTPTGSTAYSLSGGGPILHPTLNAIALVPMFPHKLSSRPIVIKNTSVIDILILSSKNTEPSVSCDGHKRVIVPEGATLHIQKHDKALTLIHPRDYDYYDTLRVKLGWEAH